MANARGKTVDKTFLSVDQAEDRGFIHRDYIAHCLRWSHFVKQMYAKKAYQTARILDVGCGRELPLAKMLYSSKLSPAMYYGVDVGPINDEDCAKIAKTGKFPHKLWEKTNLLEVEKGDVELPNYVTMFEVLEHVEPKMMIDMLNHLKSLTSQDARFFFSTPCWDRVNCADNHVNEMTYEALGSVFESLNFEVVNVWGTFASIRDYENLLHRSMPGEQEHMGNIFDKLRSYYDSNVLSCIFAPLFPAQSRNCLWELRKLSSNNYKKKFNGLSECSTPWGSSALWADMRIK